MFWGAVSAAVFFVLLAAALAAAHFWLKSGNAAEYAGPALSRMTGMDVSFESLRGDVLSGEFYAGGAKVMTADGMTLSVKSVEINADTSSILGGKLIIDRVYIDRPYGALPATKGQQAAAPEREDAEKAQEKKPLVPAVVLPLPVKIASLTINRAGADVSAAKVEDISLALNADAGPDGLALKARLISSENSSIAATAGDISVKTRPEIDITVSMEKDGKASVKGRANFTMEKFDAPYPFKLGKVCASFDITADTAKKLSAKGDLTAFIDDLFSMRMDGEFEDREYGYHYLASVHELTLNLDRVPEDLLPRGTKVKGELKLSSLKAGGLMAPENVGGTDVNVEAAGVLTLRELVTPQASARGGALVNFALEKGRMDKNGYSGKLALSLSAPGVDAGAAAVKEVSARLSADLSGALDVKTPAGNIGPTAVGDIKAVASVANARVNGVDSGPVKIDILSSGAFAAGDIHRIIAQVAARGATGVRAEGAIEKFGQKSFNAKVELTAPLAEWNDVPGLDKAPFKIEKGAASVRLSAKGSAGEGWANPAADVSLAGDIAGLAGMTGKPAGRLLSTDVKINAQGKIKSMKDMGAVTANVTVRSDGVDVPGAISSGPFTASVAASSAEPLKAAGAVELGVEADDITAQVGEGEKVSFPLSIKASGERSANGEISIQRAKIDMKNAGSATATGWLAGDGKRFRADARADGLDLAAIYNLVPGGIREALPVKNVGGVLSASASAQGTVPSSASVYPFPVDASVSLKLHDGAFEAEGAAVKGMGIDASVSASGKAARAYGQVWADKAISEKVFGKDAVSPAVDFGVEFSEDNRLRIGSLTVTVPELGVAQTLEGEVSGVDIAKIMKDPNPGRILPALGADVSLFVSAALDKQRMVPAGLGLTGDMTAGVVLKATPNTGASLSGAVEARRLNVTKEGASVVKELNGRLPFSKTVSYRLPDEGERAPAKKEKELSVRDTSFFEDLRGGGATKDSFTVRQVDAGPLKIDDVMFDLYFKESRLGVDYFKASLLSGGITGSFHIKSEGGAYVFRSSEVFAGLDLEKILNRELGLGGSEAQVDGSVSVELAMKNDETAESIDISRIDAAVNLSRIGAKALDRLLLFIDPEESSPAVMNARTVLKYASPARVEMLAKHGNLSLTIDLKYSPLMGGMTVTMPVIKRFPINNLANVESIKSHIKKLSALKMVMRAVGATAIEIGSGGDITLR